MKTVLLMRHAEAADAINGMRDFERPLTDAGCVMAAKTAAVLKMAQIQPALTICSAAHRTTQTAQILHQLLAPDSPLTPCEELYNASAERYSRHISAQGSDDCSTILFVGHNPGLAMLLCYWAGRITSVPPCTMGVFEFDTDDWSQIAHAERRLRFLIRKGSEETAA